MAAIRIYRRLQDLQDVDPNGLPQSGIPRYHTDVSSFVVETIAGGAGGSFSLGASTGGNTVGDTGVTGTRVVLAGVGNITLSQATDGNGGTISISGGTAAGGNGVAISASDSLFSTGTVVLSGAGGGATVNTAPGTIQISVAAPVAQSVQTQDRFNLTLDGNTAGALQEVSSGTLTLAGGNGITLSQNGNAITVSGETFSQSVQPETQTFIGGIAGSNTTYTSGTVSIVGSGIVTVQSGTGQRIIINASQSVQPETQTFVAGIIASNTTYTSGSIRFTGVGGGVTVSSNTGQRVDISVAAQTGTQFSGGLSNVGNTSGDTGTVGGRLLLAGGNNITVSGSTNGASMTVTISGPNVGGAQTGISGIANSQTTYTSGTVSLSELGAITIRSTTGNQFQFSVNSQSVQTQGQMSAGVSTGGNTSGDTGVTGTRLVFVGSNNITLSQATAAAGGTITISGPTTAAQTNQTLGMYALSQTVGQSSSTTMDARTLSINFDGIVSGGYSNGSLRISATTAQSVQTQGILSAGVSTGGNTSGNTQVSTGSRLVFVGSNNITLSQGTAAGATTITVSGPTTAAQTGTQFSAGISNIGNTSGDTGTVAGRLVLAGGNNITLSGSTNGVSETVTISAGAGGGFSAGVSNLGNTAGATGVSGTRLVLVGTNNVTLSQTTDANGATVSFSGAGGGAGQFSAGVSTGGNTAGATGLTGTQMVFVGSSPISLSQTTGANGGTITINAPATSSLVGASGITLSTNGSTVSILQTSGGPFVREWNPYNEAAQTLGQQGQGTLHLQPAQLPGDLQMDRFGLGLVISNASNSSNSITISAYVGVYTKNVSTMSLVTSISTSTNFSGSGTVGSYSLYGGRRWMTVPLTTTFSQGDYYIGIDIRTTTGGGAGHSVSQVLMTQYSHATFSGWSGVLGAGTNATMQVTPGLGTYSVTTAGIPTAIAFNEITGSGTLVMQPPIFMARSGTV